jgi:hypothetical protein
MLGVLTVNNVLDVTLVSKRCICCSPKATGSGLEWSSCDIAASTSTVRDATFATTSIEVEGSSYPFVSKKLLVVFLFIVWVMALEPVKFRRLSDI